MLGTEQSGSLVRTNDTKVYSFTAVAGDRFGVEAASPSGGDFSWVLYDPWGRYVDSGNKDTIELTLHAQYAGTYRFRLSRRSACGARAGPGPAAHNTDDSRYQLEAATACFPRSPA